MAGIFYLEAGWVHSQNNKRFLLFYEDFTCVFFFFFIRKGKELNSSYTEVSGRGHPFKCLARWR